MAKTAKKPKPWVIAASVLALGWAALFFSGKGILVSSHEKGEGLATTMSCIYFTGGGFVDIDLIKLNIGMLGAQVCPRVVDVE
ncbi:MAG TPA: YobH family protein [Sphingomonadales bacterium]|nr:YobH family protein [Sphingomonadales bacterium]